MCSSDLFPSHDRVSLVVYLWWCISGGVSLVVYLWVSLVVYLWVSLVVYLWVSYYGVSLVCVCVCVGVIGVIGVIGVVIVIGVIVVVGVVGQWAVYSEYVLNSSGQMTVGTGLNSEKGKQRVYGVSDSITNLIQDHKFDIPNEYKLSKFMTGLKRIQLIKGSQPINQRWKHFDLKHLCLGYSVKKDRFIIDEKICKNPFKLIDEKILKLNPDPSDIILELTGNHNLSQQKLNRIEKYKQLGYKQYE